MLGSKLKRWSSQTHWDRNAPWYFSLISSGRVRVARSHHPECLTQAPASSASPQAPAHHNGPGIAHRPHCLQAVPQRWVHDLHILEHIGRLALLGKELELLSLTAMRSTALALQLPVKGCLERSCVEVQYRGSIHEKPYNDDDDSIGNAVKAW